MGLGDIIALLSLPPPEIWVKGADEIPLTPPTPFRERRFISFQEIPGIRGRKGEQARTPGWRGDRPLSSLF